MSYYWHHSRSEALKRKVNWTSLRIVRARNLQFGYHGCWLCAGTLGRRLTGCDCCKMKDTAALFGCAYRVLVVIWHSLQFTWRILKLCRIVLRRRLAAGILGQSLIVERLTMRQLPLKSLVLHNTSWLKTNHFAKRERIQFSVPTRNVALRLSSSLMATSAFASFISLNFYTTRNSMIWPIAVFTHHFASLRKLAQGKSYWRQKSPE